MDLRILVLEDNPAHQKLITAFLEQLGIKQFDIARNSREFFAIVEDRPEDFDAVILDIQLDEDSMTGLDVYRLYRKSGGRMPAIVVTMDTNAVDQAELRQIGVVQVVDKTDLYDDHSPLPGALQRVQRRLMYDRFEAAGCVYVPVAGETVQQLPIDDVLFIQSKAREITVHTTADVYPSDISLRQYSGYLEPHGFITVSRSCIANLSKIDQYHSFDQTITFTDDANGNRIKVADDRVGTVRKTLKR